VPNIPIWLLDNMYSDLYITKTALNTDNILEKMKDRVLQKNKK